MTIYGYPSATAGTNKDAILTIEYTPAAGGDTTPPASITGLANSTATCEQITWTWDDSISDDADQVMIWQDNVYLHNVSANATEDVWSSLTGGQTYEFASHTCDFTGNCNATWVNMSATPDLCGTSFFTANLSDAGIQRDAGSGEAFTTVRNGEGNEYWNYDIANTDGGVGYASDETTDLLAYMSNLGLIFDTGAIPDNDAIDEATLKYYIYDSNIAYGTLGLTTTGFTPTTGGQVNYTDYNKFGNTILSSNLTFATDPFYRNYTMTLNAAGKNAINKTGNTNLMVRSTAHTDNITPSWIESVSSVVLIYTHEFGSKFPVLTVKHHGFPNLPINGTYAFYPSDHIYRAKVDDLPLDSRWTTYRDATYYGIDGPDLWLAVGSDYNINVVNSTYPKRYLSNISYPGHLFSDNIEYPLTSDPLISTESDHIMMTVNLETQELYELFVAVPNGNGTYHAEAAIYFDLQNYTLRPENWPSASASGLPLAPGTLRYNETDSGTISHLLVMGIPDTNESYVWPARIPGNNATGVTFPPMGQRFRLNASFDAEGYTTHQQTIITALKEYGAMVVDQTGDTEWFGLFCDNDTRWNYELDYVNFTGIHWDDFEAVDVSGLMISEDSGQVDTEEESIILLIIHYLRQFFFFGMRLGIAS